ncbi:MAG: RNA methyltransferase [Terracidiphilus sp.]
MPPIAQRDPLDVVLVSPRNPLNIGAAARAMANFGFEHLCVVSPFAPTWREARSAVGAPELLASARESATLAAAVAGCTLVLGTGTLTYRKPEQPVVLLPDLAPRLARELARGGRIALVFGPEKHGLTREDLSYCHLLVEIPTDPRQPSMNLGQAVAVCLYELATRGLPGKTGLSPRAAESGRMAGPALMSPAPGAGAPKRALTGDRMEAPACHGEPVFPAATAAASGQLERLAEVVGETLLAAGVSPRTLQAAYRRDLRLLLRRLAISDRDALRILGLFRHLLWRLKGGVRGEQSQG